MTDTDIHSCGYYCDRPLCIKAQRDELRNKMFSDQAVKTYLGGKPNYTQPELNKRTMAKTRQEAWDAVHKDYKDDPECCFALGFDAGYDAVAQRVEPPEMESGGGFESLPASPIAWMTFTAYGEEDDIHYENPEGHLPEGWTYKPLYTTPPQREWVGLTDDEKLTIVRETDNPVDALAATEAKLKEKNT